jgi:hypothetical protein
MLLPVRINTLAWLTGQICLGEALLRLSYHLTHHCNQVGEIRHQLYWWNLGCGPVGSYSPLIVVHIWQSFNLCDRDDDSIPGSCDQ